jgi:Cd2+/Zn2+-exporting ATPase
VADTVRPEAAGTIARLRRVGVKRVVMITGDNERVAADVARQVGIDEYRADVLPEAKMDVIAELKRDGRVAMVGDGVNDAPALATADLGIAMGGAGTDVALETADMVLMTDDLNGVAYAIELSRQTNRTIVQNLTFSLGVIVVLFIAALTVGIPLPLGVVGHEGSTVVVVLNGLRLLAWGRS